MYRAIICGDSECPTDPEFEHRPFFGCVPRDFSDRTGRSRTRRQTETDIGLPYSVHLWDGGCDAAGITAERKVAEHQRRTPGRTIVLDMGSSG